MNRHLIRSVLVVLLLITPSAYSDWLEFTDESATRLVTDEDALDPVGLDDPFEKDFGVADLDLDGDQDLVVFRKVRFSTPGGKRNALFLNENGVLVDRTAEFAPEFADLTDDRDVALVDVNSDRWIDIVTVTTFSDQPRIYMNLKRDDDGNWLGFDWEPSDNRLPTFNPAPKFCAIGVGDIDNDLDLDLFFVDYSNNLEDRLLINDGDGFFTDETASRMTAAMSQSAFGTDAQILDMNGDGAADIVKISTLDDFPNSVRILYNAGGDDIGTFDDLHHAYEGQPYMMEVGDLNNDERPDIYVVDDLQDSYLINTGTAANGRATFTTIAQTTPVTSDFGGNTYLVDFDRDNYLDVLVADVDTDFQICDGIRPAILRNRGNTPNVALDDPFNQIQPPWLPGGVFDFAVIDLNGDEWPDLVAGTCTGNRVLMNPGPRIFEDGFESGDLNAWSTSDS
ncbi:MAG: VCBS repeat-containing protein [Acidobacteriota bacterium]